MRTYQFRDQWYVFLRWSELRHAVDVFEQWIVSVRPAENQSLDMGKQIHRLFPSSTWEHFSGKIVVLNTIMINATSFNNWCPKPWWCGKRSHLELPVGTVAAGFILEKTRQKTVRECLSGDGTLKVLSSEINEKTLIKQSRKVFAANGKTKWVTFFVKIIQDKWYE